MPIDVATAALAAIEKTSELIVEIISGHAVRKLKYNKEAGQQYIFVDEKIGKYRDMTDSNIKAWKLHWRKRAFDE